MLGAGVEVALDLGTGKTSDDLVGHILTLELLPPTGVTISVRMAGQIVYANPAPYGRMRVRVQFSGLTESELEILQALDVMRAVW